MNLQKKFFLFSMKQEKKLDLSEIQSPLGRRGKAENLQKMRLPKKKIVIFLDSCFWHGCPEHCRMPKSNISYWEKKIERNKLRDKEVTNYYKSNNFKIFRFWEHDLNKNFEKILKTIESELSK